VTTATVMVAKSTVAVPPVGITPPGGSRPPSGSTPPTGSTPPAGSTPPHPAPVPPTGPKPTGDKTAPKIVVYSPKTGVYKIGRWLKIKISLSDRSGGVRWTATVNRVGHKARNVKHGAKLHLSRTGKSVLRVTAKDRFGNSATRTVFRVIQK
jgi:hypothetical protein